MKLLLRSPLQPLFPIYCLGWLHSELPNPGSRVPDYILSLIGDLHFGVPIDWCLGHMWVSIYTREYGTPFVGLIFFSAPLYFCAKNISLHITPPPIGFHWRNQHTLVVLRCLDYYKGEFKLGASLYDERADGVSWNNLQYCLSWFPKYLKVTLLGTVSYPVKSHTNQSWVLLLN